MKTAIVMEINAGRAHVMKTGGEFETIPAQKGWQKGDVVAIAEKRRSFRALYAAAACLVLMLFGALGGHQLYFTETALVSVDINPSIELSLNRFERVIGTAFYNEDGEALLADLGLTGMKCDDALEALLRSDALKPYLKSNDYLDLTVSGNEPLRQRIQDQTQGLTSRYALRVACQSADEETVAAAHAHGMTPGRYLAFLELQELEPEVAIEDYTACGVGQIHREIEAHHQNRYRQQEGHGGGQGAASGSGSADETTPPSGTGGQGEGYGHGQGNRQTHSTTPGDTAPIGEAVQGDAQGHGDRHGWEQGGGQTQEQNPGQNQEQNAGQDEAQNLGQNQEQNAGQDEAQGIGQNQEQNGGQDQTQGAGQNQEQNAGQNQEQGAGQNQQQGGGQGHSGGQGQGGGHGKKHS